MTTARTPPRPRATIAARRLPPLAAAIAATLALASCGAQEGTSPPAVRPVAADIEAPVATPPTTTARPAIASPATAAKPQANTNLAQTSAPAPSPTPVPKPRILYDPIPFGPERKAQMVAYVARHYGSFMRPTYRLLDPHVIVIHYTETPSFQATFNTFAPDTPDPELHELPNTCAHFVIDRAGLIHQLVPLGIMCRHTVGLNWTAIGIEHVGYSDAEVLGDAAQMRASLELVRWLRCRYGIPVVDVIGHNESLSSPYHREDVPSLRTQTHSDFNHADMQVYRARLRADGGCGASA